MGPQPIRIAGLLTLILFFSIHLNAQSDYDDYSASDKTFKYREDFSKPSYRWESDVEGKSTAEIRDGVLVFKSINDKAQAKYTPVDGMNWSGDWELEIGVRWVNGKQNSSIDFVWDRIPGQTRKYHFGFTGAGKYNLAEYNEGYQQIVGFTKASFVNRTTRNRLTVRKVKNTYYFFVNERFVKSHPYKAMKGDHIGFVVPPSSVIHVDYLYARQLEKRNNSYASSNNSLGSNNRQRTGYVAVMTKNNGYNLQRWKTRDNFPKEGIKSDWNDGFSISSLSYDNKKWSLVMSKGTGYSTQTWITRREWKKEDIKEKWDQGYKITEVSYGNGVYAVVFSKTNNLGRQRWATKISGFPSDKIREFASDGLKISKVIYGKDRWVLVATGDNRIKNQKWFKRAKFPAEDIETYTVQGYSVTQLSQENGWWVLVMSQYHNRNLHSIWFRSNEFPKTKIREYWDEDYYLTGITYTSPGNQPASPSPSKTANNTTAKKNMKTRLLGNWYGGADGDKQGYLRFYSDDIIRMISGADTVGGYNYQQEGIKLDVKYELNSFNTPNQLDIVFYSGGNVFGKMKGIIRFKDDDTFELKLAPQLGSPRPGSFSSTTENKVATFRRVR